MTKVAAVIGASGFQGSGVAKALLKDGWSVRAVSRKPEGDTLNDLKALGAEIVVADLNNEADLEKAFKGTDSVFVVTNFWEVGADAELRQGKLAIDVAKKVGVSHVVYSSVENAEKISGGKYKVPHFTYKARVDDHLYAQTGLTGSSVQMSCYYENWASWFVPKPNAEGVYEFTLAVPADTKFALGSVADVGPVTAIVLGNKEQFAGKKVAIVGDYLSPNEIATTFQKVWGKPVRANIVPPEVFAKFPFPGADELADMFGWFGEFGYYGEKVNQRDVWEAKKLYPGLKTFEQWLRESFPQPKA